MEQKDKKYYTIGVVSKTFAIIELLSTKSSFALNELCKILKMPKTTVQRILLTLCDEGYVEQRCGGIYALSYKLFSVGRNVVNNCNIVEISRPYMLKLLDKYNETINLCVASGLDMVIIAKDSTKHTLKPDNIVGTSFAIFYSASGKALLAFQQANDYKKLIDKILLEAQPTITPNEFEKFLLEQKRTKLSGLAYDNEEIYDGVRCVASPILDHDNNPIATIGISIPSARLSIEKMHQIENGLLEIATKISQRLGSSHHFNLMKNV